MAETFFILLAGGIMLASAIPDPREVTLLWLRLAGIIALSLTALSLFFFWRREEGGRDSLQFALYGGTIAAILGQLAFVQVAWRKLQRVFAVLAYATAVATGLLIVPRPPLGSPGGNLWITLALAGVAAMTGLALM